MYIQMYQILHWHLSLFQENTLEFVSSYFSNEAGGK